VVSSVFDSWSAPSADVRAILVWGGYAVTLVVVAVSTLISGGIRIPLRLTLFVEMNEGR
jgi:hypothetical protein